MVFVELENGSTRAGDNQKQGGINTSLFNRKIHREKSAVEMEYGSIRQYVFPRVGYSEQIIITILIHSVIIIHRQKLLVEMFESPDCLHCHSSTDISCQTNIFLLQYSGAPFSITQPVRLFWKVPLPQFKGFSQTQW